MGREAGGVEGRDAPSGREQAIAAAAAAAAAAAVAARCGMAMGAEVAVGDVVAAAAAAAVVRLLSFLFLASISRRHLLQ